MILGALAAGFGARALADASDGWMEYSYAEDGFAIHGPAQAVAVTENGHSAVTHAYMISSGAGSTFMVKVTRNAASRQANERKLEDIAARNPQIVKAITQAGMRGVQFGFEDTDGASKGRILAGDRMLYSIFAQGPAASFPVASLDRWLDGFRLLKPAK